MSEDTRTRDDAPSSSVGLPAPVALPHPVAISGKRTRVVIERVPGGVSIHAHPSPVTRFAWVGASGFFAVPTLGIVGAGLAGLAMVLSGKIVGAVMAAVCLPAGLVLTLATYRALCIALNTTHVDADAHHIVVRSTPLPMLRGLDVKTKYIDAFDVEWQGGVRDEQGAFWALFVVLVDGERRPLVQNLSSQSDALALRKSLEEALGRTHRGEARIDT